MILPQRWTTGVAAPLRGRRIGLLRVLVPTLAVLVAACRAPAPLEPPPDIVLVTIDTLRRDHVGAYGSRPTATPVIDALAAEGTLFENATSPMPETRPSHFTLFTSSYPRDHGVLSNLAHPRDDLVTLAAQYRNAGYQTGAFVGCGLFDERARSTLGFDHLDSPGTPQRPANAVVPVAIDWLETLAPGRPFFVWLHLFDPHMPYEPPPGFGPEPDDTMTRSWPSFDWPRLLRAADANGGDLPAPVFARARALYRGEVEHADHWLGRFIEALRSRGRWDKTLMVVTADHGECFADGVFFDHSQCLSEAALAVPLVMRFPGRVAVARRVAAQVELLDIAPTLLRLSGLEVPSDFAGDGLLSRAASAVDGESFAFFERPRYFSADVGGRNEVLSRLRSVAGQPTRKIEIDRFPVGARSGRWKYFRDQDGERLVDLLIDPREAGDLAAFEVERTERFRAVMRRWLAEHRVPALPGEELGARQRQLLKSLGYF